MERSDQSIRQTWNEKNKINSATISGGSNSKNGWWYDWALTCKFKN